MASIKEAEKFKSNFEIQLNPAITKSNIDVTTVLASDLEKVSIGFSVLESNKPAWRIW